MSKLISKLPKYNTNLKLYNYNIIIAFVFRYKSYQMCKDINIALFVV